MGRHESTMTEESVVKDIRTYFDEHTSFNDDGTKYVGPAEYHEAASAYGDFMAGVIKTAFEKETK